MPLRESLGGALLRAGNAIEAESVFRRRFPRNGPMLFGLMKALEAQQKNEAAEFVRAEYAREWKPARVTLGIGDL
jgi:hypothetical protein